MARRNKYAFGITILLLLTGIVALASGWNGNAGADLAVPVAGSSFKFCGEATGWHALLGIIGLLSGIIALIISGVMYAVSTVRD